VEVTISYGPGRSSGRTALALAIVVALVAAIALALPGGHEPVRRHPAAHAVPESRATAPGAAGVAAAYGYPLGCLSVSIARGDPEYASARLERADPCWRIGAYGVALFRREHGTWRLIAQTAAARCERRAAPRRVLERLGACP
jgi:hypothetical protein